MPTKAALKDSASRGYEIIRRSWMEQFETTHDFVKTRNARLAFDERLETRFAKAIALDNDRVIAVNVASKAACAAMSKSMVEKNAHTHGT